MFLRTLLDRYIFTELLSPFSISLGALCFVMLTRELLRLVELFVSKGVGIVAVLQVFVNLMPSFLVLTLSIAGIIAEPAVPFVNNDKVYVLARLDHGQ